MCDHPLAGKHCEAPDQVGPPISYMEEQGFFNPAESVDNPMGLCQFYHTSPEKSNVLTSLKSADSARKIYRMIEIAKRTGQQLTIVIFDRRSISPLYIPVRLFRKWRFTWLERSGWGYVTMCIVVPFAHTSLRMPRLFLTTSWLAIIGEVFLVGGVCPLLRQTPRTRENTFKVVGCPILIIRRCTRHTAKSIEVRSPAGNPRKGRKERTKVLARQHGRSHAIHQHPKSSQKSSRIPLS